MTPRKAVAAAAAFAGLMMILVGIGQYHSFTVVPIWDMWNGEVEFFMKARGGDLLAWFGQHNEHRITLARLLFWADLDWFGIRLDPRRNEASRGEAPIHADGSQATRARSPPRNGTVEESVHATSPSTVASGAAGSASRFAITP